MTYIAGFDILYACQDVDFDTSAGLHSLPSRWGIEKALAFSSALHVLTAAFLAGLGFAFDLGRLFFGLLAVISGLLFLEHRMVRPDRLEAIPVAFFHVNSVVSVLLFLAVWLDLRLS
jgi:4-hydroxybenzoate polyprenyltransferase